MYTKTLADRIFHDLRGYLPGAGLEPVLSLECAGIEYSTPPELTLSCTASNLTPMTLSHAPHTRAVSFSLYSHASVSLHVLFLLPGIPFHLSCTSLPVELSLILNSPGKHAFLLPPGRHPKHSKCLLSFTHHSVSLSHTIGNTVSSFGVGNV